MGKPRLWITTPSIRLGNLALMEKDPELRRAPEFFDVRWRILVDCFTLGLDVNGVYHTPLHPWEDVTNLWVPRPEGTRHFGEDLYGYVADIMPEDVYWMGLADDSVPVPGVFEALRREVDLGADVVVFPMHIPGVVHCLARPEDIRPSHMSGGQVFHRRGVQGPLRWRSGDATLDGIFVKELWERTQGIAKWHFCNDGPLIKHNQLRDNAVPGGLG